MLAVTNIEVWSDGSSIKNPGPSGAAYVIRYFEQVGNESMPVSKVVSGSKGFRVSTNNRMEITAGILGLTRVLELIDDKTLEALKKDFRFKSLTEHKLVLITENKPKSLISAAEEIAEKDAEIAKLKAELAKANGKLEYAEASGKDVDEEIDTESTIEIDEEQPTTKKKSSKK